jgi:hypothetical protein
LVRAQPPKDFKPAVVAVWVSLDSRVHQTLRVTAAMEAGLQIGVWSVYDSSSIGQQSSCDGMRTACST